MRVAAKLGPECRRARHAAGIDMLEVAQAAGMSEAQISQFERGRSWPRRVDDVVEAYEHECGLEDGAIWRRVIG